MSDKILSEQQNQLQTQEFLKTNGPSDGQFDPPPHFLRLLEGKSEADKTLHISTYRQEAKIDYAISNIVGVKKAHRLLHTQVQGIVEDVAPWKHARATWITGKKFSFMLIAGIVTLAILPAVGVLISDVLKPGLLRLFHVHP